MKVTYCTCTYCMCRAHVFPSYSAYTHMYVLGFPCLLFSSLASSSSPLPPLRSLPLLPISPTPHSHCGRRSITLMTTSHRLLSECWASSGEATGRCCKHRRRQAGVWFLFIQWRACAHLLVCVSVYPPLPPLSFAVLSCLCSSHIGSTFFAVPQSVCASLLTTPPALTFLWTRWSSVLG